MLCIARIIVKLPPSIRDELRAYIILPMLDTMNNIPLWNALLVLNIIYGFFFSLPTIIIICFSTLTIIRKEHKKGDFSKKGHIILTILCLLNIVACLGSLDMAIIWIRQ